MPSGSAAGNRSAMEKRLAASGPTLASLPDDLLLDILGRLGLDERLTASRACRGLRRASSALEWRVRLDLRDNPDPDPRLAGFVEWATGGLGGRPRNVTRLSLWHQVALGTGINRGRPTRRLPSRSPPGPEGHHGSPVALSCLRAIPTLVSLDLVVCHPHSLAGLGELTSVRELQVAGPIGRYIPQGQASDGASSHDIASRILEGSLVALQGLASLDLAGFLIDSYTNRTGDHEPLAWLQRLTQLTHIKVNALDVTHAVWALPRLEHLHIEDQMYEPAPHGLLGQLLLGSDQLSRLTLEACSLEADQGVLSGCVRALELLRCQGLRRLPSALPPSKTLSQLRIEAPEWNPYIGREVFEYISGYSSVTALHVCGVFSPSLLEDVRLPNLRSLKLGYRSFHFQAGCARESFTHLSRLEDLTVEVPKNSGTQVPLEQLRLWLPQGCRVCVVESDALEAWYPEEEEGSEEEDSRGSATRSWDEFLASRSGYLYRPDDPGASQWW